ncbi:cellulase family glycosylhydrolase [Bradyrhizobium diazoefficiens]|nr:Ig-like domain-containing protein [Bradyrhizobium diazoefficiens]MBR0931021.1 cellulase family glycosylhydrolase [Bradyrhizobium diazoefficiens]
MTTTSAATVGVNVSGAEYSWMPFVGAGDLDYLASQGVSLIRLPISWERMQPTLNGPLDPTYLSGLETVLSEASARDIKVIIDLHNYGRYNLNYAADAAANYGIVAPNAAGSSVIGSSEVPMSAFADFWSLLAGQLSGHAGLAGYDIMNEPYNMGSSTIWPEAAQAAVDAIRSADMKTPIYVEGYQWASAENWLVYNANLHISDPANKIIYEAHQYFDANGSGQYAQSYVQQGATSSLGAENLQPFLDWLATNNYQGFVGELGVPGNDSNWTALLNSALTQLQAAGVSSTVWNYVYADPSGKNSWWPVADSMSINPKEGWGAATMEAIFAHSAPTVASFSPDSAVAGDGITNVNHVTLTGTAAAGATVQVFDGPKQIGTSIANASGDWSFATGKLADGSHAFTSKAVNAAGNISATSAALTLTVDTVAPSAPTMASFSPDSAVAGDGITNVNHVTLTGTAAAGATVQVFDGAKQIGTSTANASGAWSFATSTLADGSHAFTSKAVDAAGNVSAASKALTVTVDTVAPSAPTVASFSPDSAVAGDGITNANHITLMGTAGVGATVQVFDGAKQIGTSTADANGVWSIATSTLIDGNHAFTSKAVDAAGNVSAASKALTVTVDTVAPSAPTVASFSPDSGVAGDGITNANHVTLTGMATAGATVQVFDEAKQIGTSIANANGGWSFATGTLADGVHAFTSTAIDAAGNHSAVSAEFDLTVNSTWSGAATSVVQVNGYGEAMSTELVTFEGDTTKTIRLDSKGSMLGAEVWTSDGASTTTTYFDDAWHRTKADVTTVSGNQSQTVHLGADWHVVGAELTTVNANSATTIQFNAAWQQIGAEISTINGSTRQTLYFDEKWVMTGAQITTVEGNATTLMSFDTDWKMTGAVVSTPYAATSFDGSWHQTPTNSSAGRSDLTVMSGTAENDVFVFHGEFGNNVIRNFQALGASHDVIQIDQSTFGDFSAVMANAVQSGDHVVITAHEGSIILEGMQLADLHRYDFHLV